LASKHIEPRFNGIRDLLKDTHSFDHKDLDLKWSEHQWVSWRQHAHLIWQLFYRKIHE